MLNANDDNNSNNTAEDVKYDNPHQKLVDNLKQVTETLAANVSDSDETVYELKVDVVTPWELLSNMASVQKQTEATLKASILSTKDITVNQMQQNLAETKRAAAKYQNWMSNVIGWGPSYLSDRYLQHQLFCICSTCLNRSV